MKYRSLLLAGAALQAGAVHAMGLGNLNVESYLGAPLQAQIDLTAAQGTAASEVKIRQADADVYARFGARDLVDHGRLQFEVYQNDRGLLSARVISAKRIVEPYIDMVVELRWPQGVTYRQYQVLLDPPMQSGHLQAAVHPVSQQPKLALAPAIAPAANKPSVKRPQPVKAPALAMQAVTTQVQSPVKPPLASKPEDEINELRAELLRLQRERAALLANRNAIQTELQSLKQVQMMVAQQESATAEPVSNPVLQAASSETVSAIAASNAPPTTLSATTLFASAENLTPPLAANVGLPVSADTLLQHFNAQELINSEQDSVADTSHGQRGGLGFWALIALLPLVFLMAFFLMRARLVLRAKRNSSVKDEDLYELVFGGRRDRNRAENKEQVGKALQQIKAKASLHQFSGSRKDAVIVDEEEATGVDLGALLSEVQLPEEEDDWMVKAPIRNLAR